MPSYSADYVVMVLATVFYFGSKVCSVVEKRGHQFKLFKHHTNHCPRSSFFCERIINVWNSLPSTVNFSSLNCFNQSIGSVDFSVFLKCS